MALQQGLGRDVAAGMTLQGPHRDDVQFSLNGLAGGGLRVAGAAAHDRAVAPAGRSGLLRRDGVSLPVLLLDDVLSEMDAVRRRSVLAAIGDMDQMLVTGTDWDRFPQEFIAGRRCLLLKAVDLCRLRASDLDARTEGS